MVHVHIWYIPFVIVEHALCGVAMVNVPIHYHNTGEKHHRNDLGGVEVGENVHQATSEGKEERRRGRRGRRRVRRRSREEMGREMGVCVNVSSCQLSPQKTRRK